MKNNSIIEYKRNYEKAQALENKVKNLQIEKEEAVNKLKLAIDNLKNKGISSSEIASIFNLSEQEIAKFFA